MCDRLRLFEAVSDSISRLNNFRSRVQLGCQTYRQEIPNNYRSIKDAIVIIKDMSVNSKVMKLFVNVDVILGKCFDQSRFDWFLEFATLWNSKKIPKTWRFRCKIGTFNKILGLTWNWIIVRALISSDFGPFVLEMPSKNNEYLPSRWTGLRRYEAKSILSPNSACFVWKNFPFSANKRSDTGLFLTYSAYISR